MITLTRVLKATNEFVKVLRFGKSDVQTISHVMPFGVDSKPIEKMVAVHSETSEYGKNICLGYLISSTKTDEGEIRLYSSNSSGSEQFYIYLKKNGTVEINGTGNFLVKYNELKIGFDLLKTELNAFVTIFNSHVHGGVTSGTAVTSPTATPGISATASIDSCKADEIKTKL